MRVARSAMFAAAIIALAAVPVCVKAEVTFTDINAGVRGVSCGSIAWGDYDNDADLDFAIAGVSGAGIVKIYRNDDSLFTDINAGLRGIGHCSLAWGDYDNDGDLDLAIAGDTGRAVTMICRNDGGIFTDIDAGLVGVWQCSIAWGDYDHDGDIDLAVAGATDREHRTHITKVYRNDAGLFTDINADLPGADLCSLAWADYDNDGDLDLALAGCTGAKCLAPIANIYRNDNGVFTDIKAGLTGVFRCSLAWGDYDEDGDPDLAVAGMSYTDGRYVRTSKIYCNHQPSYGGARTFTDIAADLVAVSSCSLAWGDYDDDGDVDLAIAGDPGRTRYTTRIYRNDRTPFTDHRTFIDIDADLLGVYECSLAWGDYDNDRDLDLAVAGTGWVGRMSGKMRCYEPVTKIYRNEE